MVTYLSLYALVGAYRCIRSLVVMFTYLSLYALVGAYRCIRSLSCNVYLLILVCSGWCIQVYKVTKL